MSQEEYTNCHTLVHQFSLIETLVNKRHVLNTTDYQIVVLVSVVLHPVLSTYQRHTRVLKPTTGSTYLA